MSCCTDQRSQLGTPNYRRLLKMCNNQQHSRSKSESTQVFNGRQMRKIEFALEARKIIRAL